jgi:cell fate (sporulation/competence/biofilm development) regulator YmcA (YheA/YmcA/DUF963 family)
VHKKSILTRISHQLKLHLTIIKTSSKMPKKQANKVANQKYNKNLSPKLLTTKIPIVRDDIVTF